MPQRDTSVAPPTMRDVAAAAGVSKALVSIVFRGVPGASEETRARVMQVAQDIGYRANRTASLLARRRSRLIGLTVEIRNAFHADLVEAIQTAADDAGYEIVLSAVGGNHSEARSVSTLLEFRCEAVILLGSDLSETDLAALAADVPIILVGRRAAVADVDVVRAADGHGQRLLVDHLVGLGHRRIAHVDGGAGIISADRRRGFRAAMRRHGLTGSVIPGGTGETDGRNAAAVLLDRQDRPTAVTAFNDQAALGVIGRLSEAGLDVPGSMSVAGYDDSPVARFAAVDLTTVNQDAAGQAAWAVRAAVQRLEESRDQQQEWVLDPILVVRGSTGPPPSAIR